MPPLRRRLHRLLPERESEASHQILPFEQHHKGQYLQCEDLQAAVQAVRREEEARVEGAPPAFSHAYEATPLGTRLGLSTLLPTRS